MKALLITLFMMMSTMAFSQDAKYDFTGSWKTEDNETVVISKTSNVFNGIDKTTSKTVMENLKFSDGKWTGTLFKKSDGSKHDGTFVVKEKTLTITVKVGFITKTFVWTKL
jgi:uncharacterized protein (DUF2147 family)